MIVIRSKLGVSKDFGFVVKGDLFCIAGHVAKFESPFAAIHYRLYSTTESEGGPYCVYGSGDFV